MRMRMQWHCIRACPAAAVSPGPDPTTVSRASARRRQSVRHFPCAAVAGKAFFFFVCVCVCVSSLPRPGRDTDSLKRTAASSSSAARAARVILHGSGASRASGAGAMVQLPRAVYIVHCCTQSASTPGLDALLSLVRCDCAMHGRRSPWRGKPGAHGARHRRRLP